VDTWFGVVPKEKPMSEVEPIDDPFKTEQQAANYLGIKFGTLRSLRKRAEGPAWKKLGTAIMYKQSWLDSWKTNLGSDTFTPKPRKPQ